MPALEKVGDYIVEARHLLQDEVEPYRYPDKDIIEALNIGLLEARRLRADLFLKLKFEPPYFDPVDVAAAKTKVVEMNKQYRSTLVYYIVARMGLRDEEPTTDQRAGQLLARFTGQMLTIAS